MMTPVTTAPVASSTFDTSRVHSLTRPNMVSVGTIIWLSSELMFFAALFAIYFTLRSVTATLTGDMDLQQRLVKVGGVAVVGVLDEDLPRPEGQQVDEAVAVDLLDGGAGAQRILQRSHLAKGRNRHAQPGQCLAHQPILPDRPSIGNTLPIAPGQR